MKLIASVNGGAVLHASADDVCPADGLLRRDLVKYIGDAYQFAARPVFQPNVPEEATPTPLTFTSGKCGELLVYQLLVFPKGDVVAGRNTDAADSILDDYTVRLDRDLKYRYAASSSKTKRTYFSNLIVEFDEALEDRIPAFRKINEIVNRAMGMSEPPFRPKILVFGHGDPAPQGFERSLDMMERIDFSLQRRVGEPYSSNRYFSSAPLKTSDHLRMLQDIEDAFGH